MLAWPGIEKRDPSVGSGSCCEVDVKPGGSEWQHPHPTHASCLVTFCRLSPRLEEVCPETSSAPAQHPLGRLRSSTPSEGYGRWLIKLDAEAS